MASAPRSSSGATDNAQAATTESARAATVSVAPTGARRTRSDFQESRDAGKPRARVRAGGQRPEHVPGSGGVVVDDEHLLRFVDLTANGWQHAGRDGPFPSMTKQAALSVVPTSWRSNTARRPRASAAGRLWCSASRICPSRSNGSPVRSGSWTTNGCTPRREKVSVGAYMPLIRDDDDHRLPLPRGRGDLLTAPWNTVAPMRSYLRRATRAGIDRTVVFPAFHSDYANRQPRARAHRREWLAAAGSGLRWSMGRGMPATRCARCCARWCCGTGFAA